jgi:hypothetical protein
MWSVRYAPRGVHQGQVDGYTPRDSLPKDEQCEALFTALGNAGHPVWALAMRLKHRSGPRWGELIALRPCDIDEHPLRRTHVSRAVEQSRQGRTIKTPKNSQQRWTIYPASLARPLAR